MNLHNDVILNNEDKEPILIPNTKRLTLFPIEHFDLYEEYKNARSVFWMPEEVLKDLSKDPEDLEKLSANELYFIKNILGFFACSDGIVNENIGINFHNQIQIPEARSYYTIQLAIETIHNETYSLIIDTYIKDPVEKKKILNSIETNPWIKKKSEWAMKWMDKKTRSFASRLVAFAILEGLFFTSSFSSIFWFKSRNLLPGLCTANQYISKDESSHKNFAVMLYHKLIYRLTQEEIEEIFIEAVELESEFITQAISCALIGIKPDEMIIYIKFTADRLIQELGYEKLYGVYNPFQFAEFGSLENKTNFFEKRVTEYSNVGATQTANLFDENVEF